VGRKMIPVRLYAPRPSLKRREGTDERWRAASRWRRAGVYTEQVSAGQSAADQRKEDGEPSAEEEMESLGRVRPISFSCSPGVDFVSSSFPIPRQCLLRQTEKERKKIKEERASSKEMEATYWLEMSAFPLLSLCFFSSLPTNLILPSQSTPSTATVRTSSLTMPSGTMKKRARTSSMFVPSSRSPSNFD
jgi:hypothetical protein